MSYQGCGTIFNGMFSGGLHIQISYFSLSNPIEGISMGKYPRVSDLLTGIFNKNSPQPKFSFMWDVKRVTKFLSSQRFERNGNLKDMT